jgi:hypothetical protein
MSDGKEGLNAAMEATKDLVRAGDGPGFEGEQLPLLEPEAIAPEEAERRRAGIVGRPPGSRNKRTQQWVDFILANFESPLITLAKIYTSDTAALARKLACTLEDALRIKISAAKELAPYLHQKQPIAVQVSSAGTVTLVIEELDREAGSGEEIRVIDGTILPPTHHNP